jgi:hypothetical protein
MTTKTDGVATERAWTDPGAPTDDRVDAVPAELTLDRSSITFRTLQRVVQPGDIVRTAGRSSRDAAASGTLRSTGATRVIPERSRILETGVRIVR